MKIVYSTVLFSHPHITTMLPASAEGILVLVILVIVGLFSNVSVAEEAPKEVAETNEGNKATAFISKTVHDKEGCNLPHVGYVNEDKRKRTETHMTWLRQCHDVCKNEDWCEGYVYQQSNNTCTLHEKLFGDNMNLYRNGDYYTYMKKCWYCIIPNLALKGLKLEYMHWHELDIRQEPERLLQTTCFNACYRNETCRIAAYMNAVRTCLFYTQDEEKSNFRTELINNRPEENTVTYLKRCVHGCIKNHIIQESLEEPAFRNTTEWTCLDNCRRSPKCAASSFDFVTKNCHFHTIIDPRKQQEKPLSSLYMKVCM